jgi:hypothetical protein
MFRKITLAVVPTAAFALMIFAADNTASQAFAKGGRGYQGVHNHGEFHNRYFGRSYGWGYPYSYSYNYGTPVCECSPVCVPVAPVVAEVATPVCTTCEPVVATSYPYSWGYGRYRHFERSREFRGGHGRR